MMIDFMTQLFASSVCSEIRGLPLADFVESVLADEAILLILSAVHRPARPIIRDTMS